MADPRSYFTHPRMTNSQSFREAVEAAYQRLIDTPHSEESNHQFMDDIEAALQLPA